MYLKRGLIYFVFLILIPIVYSQSLTCEDETFLGSCVERTSLFCGGENLIENGGFEAIGDGSIYNGNGINIIESEEHVHGGDRSVLLKYDPRINQYDPPFIEFPLRLKLNPEKEYFVFGFVKGDCQRIKIVLKLYDRTLIRLFDNVASSDWTRITAVFDEEITINDEYTPNLVISCSSSFNDLYIDSLHLQEISTSSNLVNNCEICGCLEGLSCTVNGECIGPPPQELQRQQCTALTLIRQDETVSVSCPDGSVLSSSENEYIECELDSPIVTDSCFGKYYCGDENLLNNPSFEEYISLTGSVVVDDTTPRTIEERIPGWNRNLYVDPFSLAIRNPRGGAKSGGNSVLLSLKPDEKIYAGIVSDPITIEPKIIGDSPTYRVSAWIFVPSYTNKPLSGRWSLSIQMYPEKCSSRYSGGSSTCHHYDVLEADNVWDENIQKDQWIQKYMYVKPDLGVDIAKVFILKGGENSEGEMYVDDIVFEEVSSLFTPPLKESCTRCGCTAGYTCNTDSDRCELVENKVMSVNLAYGGITFFNEKRLSSGQTYTMLVGRDLMVNDIRLRDFRDLDYFKSKTIFDNTVSMKLVKLDDNEIRYEIGVGRNFDGAPQNNFVGRGRNINEPGRFELYLSVFDDITGLIYEKATGIFIEVVEAEDRYIKILDNGDSDDKYDIVFITANLDYNHIKSEVEEISQQFTYHLDQLGLPLDFINIYLIKGSTEERCDVSGDYPRNLIVCNELLIRSEIRAIYGLDDFELLVIIPSTRVGTLVPSADADLPTKNFHSHIRIPYNSFFGESNPFFHEFGHAFGSLADEYVEYDTDTFRLSGYIELSPNCDLSPSCTKWYDYHSGCYQGCTTSDAFRSILSSIMRDHRDSDEWGEVNTRAMQRAYEEFINFIEENDE